MSMRRREFITLLGGAAAAWPLAARAQQPKMPVVGWLHLGRRDDGRSEAFRQGLRETGFIEGQNVTVEHRLAENNAQAQEHAAEFVRRQVAVIVTSPNAIAGTAAKDATTSIPIVFMSGPDPVRTGLVTSLNRPGRNLTGVTQLSADLTAKRLGLLHDLLPQASVVAMLLDRSGRDPEFQLREAEAAAGAVGLRILGVYAGTESEFDAALASVARAGAQALLVSTSVFLTDHREVLAVVAAKYNLPAVYQTRFYTASGGLMSYGPSNDDLYRQVGVYAGRILKGEKPGDLPVMLPAKFEFVINLKAAKALGLEISPTFLLRADELIE
jgi:putative ABC transport system substrate-binding protein